MPLTTAEPKKGATMAASPEQQLPEPTSPYPGDPDRSQARCPDHGNPLHWTGQAFICKRCRPNAGGRPVDPDRIVWGKPAAHRRTTHRVRQLDPIYYQRLYTDQEAVVAELLATGQAKNKNDAVRQLVDAGVRSHRRRHRAS